MKSSEEALTHLEEVISQVVSEAVEYADKPPEERTLPALVRKSVTQQRSRPVNTMGAYGQMGMVNNGANIMGIGQMGAYGFSSVPGQMHPDNRFASASHHFINIYDLFDDCTYVSCLVQNAALLQQTPQRMMSQYNGIQTGQYLPQNAQMHQQYTQAAQQFQIQQQQTQYQIQLQQQVRIWPT